MGFDRGGNPGVWLRQSKVKVVRACSKMVQLGHINQKSKACVPAKIGHSKVQY
jgi:hypothetical protein